MQFCCSFFCFFCGGCIKKEKLPKNKNADNFLLMLLNPIDTVGELVYNEWQETER